MSRRELVVMKRPENSNAETISEIEQVLGSRQHHGAVVESRRAVKGRCRRKPKTGTHERVCERSSRYETTPEHSSIFTSRQPNQSRDGRIRRERKRRGESERNRKKSP